MNKKKRAQVTLFIIIGIILLFSFALIYYLIQSYSEEVQTSGVISLFKVPQYALPVTSYVTSNLEQATREGLYLIGMQGGYIYDFQGGLIPFGSLEQGEDFVPFAGYNVSYGLKKEKNNYHNYYFADPPLYPWFYYPYPSHPRDSRTKFFGGFFGFENLPSLDNETDPMSIKMQLEAYITNYLEENIDLSVFEDQGFEIKQGEMRVSVDISKRDVTAFLEFPIEIIMRHTGESTDVNLFYTTEQVRLRSMHRFALDIIKKDTTDILNDILNYEEILRKNFLTDDVSVEVIGNAYVYDDMIVIEDTLSKLYTNPYIFQFARQNRPPALWFIDRPAIFFIGAEAVRGAEIKESHFDGYLFADDPDGDDVTFYFEPELPIPLSMEDFDRGYIDITVFVIEDHEEGECSLIDGSPDCTDYNCEGESCPGGVCNCGVCRPSATKECIYKDWQELSIAVIPGLVT